MGYRVERKVYALKFGDDTDYPGMEVKLHAASLGDYMKMIEKGRDGDPDAGEYEQETFARCLVEWNLEDETGKPIPATLDGVLSLDLLTVRTIKGKWFDVTQGVPDPLENGSTSGAISPVVSLPMEPLSESQAS